MTKCTLYTENIDLLIVFNQLVKAKQDAKPSCTVVWLQIEANLIHDGRPLAGIVMLDHVVDTCGQLDPEKFKSTALGWGRCQKGHNTWSDRWKVGQITKREYQGVEVGTNLSSLRITASNVCSYLMRSGEWMIASTMLSRMNCLSSSGMLLIGVSEAEPSPSLQCWVIIFLR